MSDPRPALFLDRDGTINVDTINVAKADNVRLIPGAAAAIARVNATGMPVIVVTESIGDRARTVYRGAVRVSSVRASTSCSRPAARRARHVLLPARIRRSVPPATAGSLRRGLYRQAAAEHGLDLAKSWFVGDRLRDIQPAKALGGHGILVPRDTTPTLDVVRARTASHSPRASVQRSTAFCRRRHYLARGKQLDSLHADPPRGARIGPRLQSASAPGIPHAERPREVRATGARALGSRRCRRARLCAHTRHCGGRDRWRHTWRRASPVAAQIAPHRSRRARGLHAARPRGRRERVSRTES